MFQSKKKLLPLFSSQGKLNFLYLSLCLLLGLYMSNLCDLLCHCHFYFHYITIKHIISLIQNNFCFGHTCQKFSLRVLLSFCLIFCQFQPGVAYKSIAYKKGVQPENQFSLVKLRSFIKNYLPLMSLTVFITKISKQKKTVSST